MRKTLFSVLLFVAAVVFAGCSDDDDHVATKYTLSVTIDYPDGVEAADVDDLAVKVNNLQTSSEYTATIADGKITVSLPAGEYDVQATGKTVEYSLSGLKSRVGVYADAATTVELNIAAGSGLVFKEIYYSMVKDGKSPYFDQFYEIYNNSEEVIYLDQLIFGIVEGGQGGIASAWVDGDGELMKKIPMVNYTMAFPGSGKEHPLEPGKSVVIAQDAFNHQSDPNGFSGSPVNLGNADWETYIEGYTTKDVDNPDVPNMDVIYATAKGVDFMIPYSGSAVIIARLPEGMRAVDFAQDDANLMSKPNAAGTTKYLMIPQEYVLDGVDLVSSVEAKRVKHLRPEVDAGRAFNSADYNGTSLRRKVVSIIDGRVVFQDTNNSSDDFLNGQVPTPGVQPSHVD